MPYFFGVNVGSGANGGANGVAEAANASSTNQTSRDVELVINTNANVPDRQSLLMALKAIEDYISGKLQGRTWS